MFSNWLEDAILNYFFRPAATAPTRPAGLYVGLSSTAPAEDGTGITPPTFTGYARQLATFGAPGDGSGTEREIANTAAVEFGDPDNDAGASHFTVHDALSGGNLLAYGALPAPVTWQAGVTDPISFPAGSLVISQD